MLSCVGPFAFWIQLRHCVDCLLQNIDLSGCQRVTDMGIKALTSGCKKMERVNVSSCYELSDAAFESLGTCTSLRSINACGCDRLTDTGLQALAQSARCAISLLTCVMLWDAVLWTS